MKKRFDSELEAMEIEYRSERYVVDSHGVVNQVDRRYLTFCHRYVPPSFKEDRE